MLLGVWGSRKALFHGKQGETACCKDTEKEKKIKDQIAAHQDTEGIPEEQPSFLLWLPQLDFFFSPPYFWNSFSSEKTTIPCISMNCGIGCLVVRQTEQPEGYKRVTGTCIRPYLNKEAELVSFELVLKPKGMPALLIRRLWGVKGSSSWPGSNIAASKWYWKWTHLCLPLSGRVYEYQRWSALPTWL